MKVRVKAAEGLRVPVGGKQYIGAEVVEVEQTQFIGWLLEKGDLVEVTDKKAAAAKAEAAQPAVKEG